MHIITFSLFQPLTPVFVMIKGAENVFLRVFASYIYNTRAFKMFNIR